MTKCKDQILWLSLILSWQTVPGDVSVLIMPGRKVQRGGQKLPLTLGRSSSRASRATPKEQSGWARKGSARSQNREAIEPARHAAAQIARVTRSQVRAERNGLVLTWMTNYTWTVSPPRPHLPGLPRPGEPRSACNAPKWLPSALRWRQGQLGVNTGDRSIQKPRNEASCNVRDWCPRC